MSTPKSRILLPVVIGFLIVINLAIAWRTVGWVRQKAIGGISEGISVAMVHTNGADALVIADTRKGEPIWIESLDRDGKPDTIMYFFQGKPAMNIYLPNGKLPRREVIFCADDGREKVSWIDRSGKGEFTERIFYEGGKPRLEIWYENAWQKVVEQENKRGIEVQGKWRRLQITNGIWLPTLSNASN